MSKLLVHKSKKKRGEILKYGYCRVSTAGQFTYGQSLEIQEESVRAAGAEIVYKDIYTGTRMDRPEFILLQKELKEGDVLIVTRLDRFARSTYEGTTIIRELFEKGIVVNILNLGIIENTPNGRLIFNLFMSFAEFERELILERMREGKERAKATRDDYVEGRPKKFGKKQIQHAIELKKSRTYKEVEELTGISKSTLYRAMQQIKGKSESVIET